MPAFEKPAINLASRIAVARAIVGVLFCILLFRLWYLQIVQGDFFRDQSENNRIRQVFIPPPRGLILDRNGLVLAKNRPAFQVDLVLEDAPNPEASIKSLAEIAGRDPMELLAGIKTLGKRRPFEPRMVLKDVTRELVAKIEARGWALPGIQVSVIPARYYPLGGLASHVLGYIGEISAKQLERPDYVGYRMSDVVGQTGIEARWERYLQGQRGVLEVVVNAAGTKIGEAAFEPQRPGQNVTLTIDADVQSAAELGLGDRRGAVVALDPRSGELWALASSPRFDPNVFVGEMKGEVWLDIVQGPDKKLTNRAVQGVYPPGSVFKIFMEAAALSEGVMSPKDHVSCPGYLQVGNRRFRCHKHAGHGSVNHYRALVESCDVYFYTAGNRLGIDRIHQYATRFGFGAITGLSLVEESPGLIPSTEWKRRRFKDPEQQKWYPGETPSAVIGQGAVTTTPLQITRGVAALLNGGRLLRPQVVKRLASGDGSFLDDKFEPEVMGTVDLEPWVVKMVREDMVGVVNAPSGTARRAQLPKEWNIIVGGKTGTAQVVGLEFKEKKADFQHHAWFVGYAPADAPEIVVSAIVENSGGGGLIAAPVVQQVLAAYFRKTRGFAVEAPQSLVVSASPSKLEPDRLDEVPPQEIEDHAH